MPSLGNIKKRLLKWNLLIRCWEERYISILHCTSPMLTSSVQIWEEMGCVHHFCVFLFQKWIDISIEPSCYFHWLNEFLNAPHCASVLEKHMAHLTLNYGFDFFLYIFTCNLIVSLRNHIYVHAIYHMIYGSCLMYGYMNKIAFFLNVTYNSMF